jgi:NAD(P)-dependent dehydrogenase (short-subunit alcohol dehydrogenase family)
MASTQSAPGPFDLTGRVALVTGASRGIGRAIAVALSSAGARIAAMARTASDLDGVVAEIGSDRAMAIAGDVNKREDNERAVAETVARYGRLDIYAPVAGTNRRKKLVDITDDDYEVIVGTNLRAVYAGCQAAVRAMIPANGAAREESGKLITVGSLASIQGVAPGMSAYAASKGGVALLTKALAVELAPHNIQVNCIAPGFILTDLNRAFLSAEPRKSWVLGRIPAGRFGAPIDCAPTAIYLAGAASDFVTGQVIAVDGGFLSGSDWNQGK